MDSPIENSPANMVQQWSNIREKTEKERALRWRERQAKEGSNLRYVKSDSLDDPHIVRVRAESDAEQQAATLCAATGSANQEYAQILMNGIFNASFMNQMSGDVVTMANAVNGALLALGPQDIIEGQLVSRLLVLHNQSTEYLRRATIPDQLPEHVDMNINRATKLMRLHNETLEVLNRYRRKGEQKVTVQHVNVENGGKAIVAGQFTQGEGDVIKTKGAHG